MITVKIGTKTIQAKDLSVRCGDDYYNVSVTLADDTTDIRTLRSEFEETFDGTVTLPDLTVITGLEIEDVSRNYSSSGEVRTSLYLRAVSNEE